MTDAKDLMTMMHGGENPRQYMNAVIPPPFLTTLHVFDSQEEYYNCDIFKDEYFYGRSSNPTVTILEKKICALEHGERAVVFSSGMAACAAAILTVCHTGSHVICLIDVYNPVYHILTDFLVPKMNFSVTYVSNDPEEIEAAIRPETDLIILESPATLVFSVVDLKKVSNIAKKHGIRTYIDNTYSTPLFQKPLDMGIDIVMHTMTKYIGGHSDLLGGVLISKDDALMRQLMEQRDWFGSVMGAMEAWLAIRGLRTLDVRLRQHQETAMAVASFLEIHPKVSRVFYTGLPSHPQYALARRQQSGQSGLLSFEVKGDPHKAVELVNHLKVFRIGSSWGGFESLALAATYQWSDEELKRHNLGRGVIRIHCGLEGKDNLIDDLKQALELI